MRCYIPATMDEIAADELPSRLARAVTTAVRAAFPDEDDEGLEYWAQMAAAEDSLAMLGPGSVPPLRVVVVADIPDVEVSEIPDGRVRCGSPVSFSDVVCLLVDEPEAADDVLAAAGGDPAAIERSGERDLLWYDVTEREFIPRG